MTNKIILLLLIILFSAPILAQKMISVARSVA